MGELTERLSDSERCTDAGFENTVHEQLKHIFPTVERDLRLRAKDRLGVVEVDLAARSANGRLLLFVLKCLEPRRKLAYSVYPLVATLRARACDLALESRPIVILLTNVDVDKSVRDMFVHGGIPVITLARDPDTTKQCFRQVLHDLAINLPEFGPREEVPIEKRDWCFVAMPFRAQHGEVYETVIAPAIRKAGLEPVRADSLISPGNLVDQVRRLIDRSKVVIAFLPEHSSNVLFELGMAVALKKPVVLIAERTESIPSDLRSFRCLWYQHGSRGTDELRDTLTESLVAESREPLLES